MSTVADVIEIRHLTDHVLELYIQPREPMPYSAGQWVSLLMPVGPKNRTKRSYSMASLMRPDDRLHLVFDHVPGGLGSEYLSCLKPGDTLEILNCMGNFVLADSPMPNILFIARYTGIVPVFAMLKQLEREGHKGRIELVYSSPCRSEELFVDQLNGLTLPGLSLHRVYLDASEVALPEEGLGTELFHTAPPEQWNVYLCGVGDMVRPLRKHFRTLGCPRTGLKSERYN